MKSCVTFPTKRYPGSLTEHDEMEPIDIEKRSAWGTLSQRVARLRWLPRKSATALKSASNWIELIKPDVFGLENGQVEEISSHRLGGCSRSAGVGHREWTALLRPAT